MGDKSSKNGAPAKQQKTFYLPPRCSCREFVMRELDGNDDLAIALWVEQRTSSIDGANVVAIVENKRREALRRALVSVDGAPVNVDGVPYYGMDGWSARTMVFVHNAFNDLNGVDGDELKKFREGAYAPAARETDAEAPDRSIGGSSAA